MPVMDALRKLELVESQLRGLRKRVVSAERYLAARDKQLEEATARHDELQARRRQRQATVANLESEVQSIDARMEKYRSDMNSASTQKQYQAVNTELAAAKADKERCEEQILQQMQEIETIDAQAAEIHAQVKERTTVRDAASADLEERRDEIAVRLAELEKERDAAAEDVPDDVLGLYDRMTHETHGEPMAAVEVINARSRDYACGECNMQLPFDRVALLGGNPDIVQQCDSCHRILYLQEETRGALVGG